MASYKHDRLVKLGGFTEKKTPAKWSERNLNPQVADLESGALIIRPRCALVDVYSGLQLYLLTIRNQKAMYYKLLVLFQELPNNGVMLVYVSGDGCPGNAKAGEEGTWEQRSNHYFISVICLFNNALFISIGPYELGGVALSHKKAGNEEAARRLRVNLKDVHWCVAFLLFQNCF